MQLYATIATNIGGAWIAGGLIGMERSFHGRAAGFRTHCLVALAASAAVMVSLAPVLTHGVFPGDAQADPGRMAQGVMTGVGFLGAGVIYKEGVNVQGLTTAASVWATAAIGLLFGVGAYFPAELTTAAVLATLLALRWAELAMPSNVYIWAVFRYRAADAPTLEGLRAMLHASQISMSEPSYARQKDGTILEYSGNLRARHPAAVHALAEQMRATEGLVEYELQRISK